MLHMVSLTSCPCRTNVPCRWVPGWGGPEFERVRCTVSFTCCCQGMSTHACMLVSVNCKCNTTLGCCILSPCCIGVPASWLRIWCSRGVLQCTRAPSTHMSCIFTMCNHCHMLCTTLCNLACIVLCTLMCLSGCLVGGDGTPKVCRVGPCNARVARPYRCRAPGHGAGNCLARRVCIIRCAHRGFVCTAWERVCLSRASESGDCHG